MDKFFELGKRYKLIDGRGEEFAGMYDFDNVPIFRKIGYNVFKVTRITPSAKGVEQIYLENTGEYMDFEFYETDGDYVFFEEVKEAVDVPSYKIGKLEDKIVYVLNTGILTKDDAESLVKILEKETNNKYTIVVEIKNEI